MWKPLSYSPARRGVYKTVNRINEFPLHFCKTCWVGDESVAACAIDVWPNIVQLIKHLKSLFQSQQPKNKSYDCLLKHHVDNLMCQFQFFQDVAGILSEFLKQFQTDRPVLPFLSDILEYILRRVMKMLLLSSHL